MKFQIFKMAEIDSELISSNTLRCLNTDTYVHNLREYFQVNTNFSLIRQEVRKEEDKLQYRSL